MVLLCPVSTVWEASLSIFKGILLGSGYLQFWCSILFCKSDFQCTLNTHILHREVSPTTSIRVHDCSVLLSTGCSGFPWRNDGYLTMLHLHTEVSKAFINLQIFIVGSLYLKNFLNVSGHKRNSSSILLPNLSLPFAILTWVTPRYTGLTGQDSFNSLLCEEKWHVNPVEVYKRYSFCFI